MLGIRNQALGLCMGFAVSLGLVTSAWGRQSSKTVSRKPASAKDVKKPDSAKSEVKKSSISYESYLQSNSTNPGLLGMRKLPQEAFKEAPRRAAPVADDSKATSKTSSPAANSNGGAGTSSTPEPTPTPEPPPTPVPASTNSAPGN